jgi:hypothetical protein
LIIDYIRAYEVYDKIEREYGEKIQEIKKQTEERVRNKHYIKSYLSN